MQKVTKNKITTPNRRGWLSKILFLIFLATFTALPCYSSSAAKPVLQSSGSDVIAAVNELRASHGLPPYQINSALMSAAQAHSEYQARIGKTTHTGADFSTPKSRAMAAGFGGGAIVFISENIASGIEMTAAQAVEIWQSDSLHLSTMLSAYATDAGAGVATDGNVTYITLDSGYVAGQAGHGPDQAVPTLAPGSPTQSPSGQPSSGFVVRSVATVTPMSDGSIIHIVQPGEVLLNIALAYSVKLSELYKLNYLNDQSVIYPGQKIKIKGPDPTSTPTVTPTLTDVPTATRRPTRTPTPAPSITPPGPTGTQSPSTVVPDSRTGPDYLLIAIGVLLVVGIGLVVTGSLLRKK